PPAPPAPAASLPAPAAPAPAAPLPAPAAPAPAAAKRSVHVARRPPEPAAAPGTLTLNATPWAAFYLDGRGLAGCPVVGLSVAAGEHAVRVVCPDHQERTQPLTI